MYTILKIKDSKRTVDPLGAFPEQSLLQRFPLDCSTTLRYTQWVPIRLASPDRDCKDATQCRDRVHGLVHGVLEQDAGGDLEDGEAGEPEPEQPAQQEGDTADGQKHDHEHKSPDAEAGLCIDDFIPVVEVHDLVLQLVDEVD